MTDSLISGKLKPTGWENGDIAISQTHFYMIYTDAKEGLSVHWYNKITGASDKRHNFQSRDDAQSWIKNIHSQNLNERYGKCIGNYDMEVGQRWAHKHDPKIIIEITIIDGHNTHTKVYSDSQPSDGIVSTNDTFVLRYFLENDYYLMNDGETIEQCLARVSANNKETQYAS